MDEFIYTNLSSHNSYKYLNYMITINSGYLYLKAINKLLTRSYTFENHYRFKSILLLRIPVTTLNNLLQTCDQEQFNLYIKNNFIYEDNFQNRSIICKVHNPILV